MLNLAHFPLVPHICVDELDQHCFRWWLAAWTAPSHYLNQFWYIVNWIPRNVFQQNFTWNSNIFSQENAFEQILSFKKMSNIFIQENVSAKWSPICRHILLNENIWDGGDQGRWVKRLVYRTTWKKTRYIVTICTIRRYWHSALYTSLFIVNITTAVDLVAWVTNASSDMTSN